MKQTAKVVFLNTEFKSLNSREIKFLPSLNPEEDFKTILNLLPKKIFKNWQEIKTPFWKIQRHHFEETNFNFFESAVLTLT